MKVKRLNYFLAPRDELHLSVAIRTAFPHVAYLDGERWTSGEPVERLSIDLCESGWAYIWNRELFPTLPTVKQEKFLQGPTTYYVIQFERNKLKEGCMQAAQLSISYDEQNMSHSAYSEKLYRLVKKEHAQKLRLVDSETRDIVNPRINNFVVGSHATSQVRQGLRLTIAFGRSTHLELMED